MKRRRTKAPRCVVIAGPNGAGKTTFAREFLPREAQVVNFVNADLIAGGLSPLRPELAALSSARLFLAELDRLARAREDFAFESTLRACVKMGSAGDSPAPVGNLPTGMAERNFAKGPSSFIRIVPSIPSGESPDGTGESPVLPGPASARAGTMCRARTCSAASSAVGRTFGGFIARLRMPGLFTIISAIGHGSSDRAHEEAKNQTHSAVGRRSPGVAPLYAHGPQNRPHVRHAHLHLEKRQGGRRKTLTGRERSQETAKDTNEAKRWGQKHGGEL